MNTFYTASMKIVIDNKHKETYPFFLMQL